MGTLQRWPARIVVPVCLGVLLAQAGYAAAETLHVEFRKDDEMSRYIIRNFEAQNPGVTIDATYGYNPSDQFALAVAEGKAPQIAIFDRYQVSVAALNGQLEPIDAYVKGYFAPDQIFLPAPAHEIMYKGALYAIPRDTDIRGLFWNIDQLDAAGLPGAQGPNDWDAFNSYAAKLTTSGPQGGITRMGFVPWTGNWDWMGWVWAFGGDYFDPDTFNPTVNLPANVRAFEWEESYARTYGTKDALAAAGFGTLWGGATPPFQNGKTSMVVMHNYAFNGINLPFKVGVGAMPHPPGGTNGTWSGGYSYVVPAGTPYSELIGKFLRYLATTEVQVERFKLTKALPVTKAAIPKVMEIADVQQRELLNQASESHWQWPYTGYIEGLLDETQWSVFNLKEPAKQMLDQAQATLLAKYPNIWGRK